MANNTDHGAPDYSLPRSGYRYVMLVNSETRYRTNTYDDALDAYYGMFNYCHDNGMAVIQLIDIETGTIADNRMS